MASGSAPVYSFPILTIDQIVDFGRQVELPFTENDIKKPNVQRWNLLYGDLLEMISGVPADQVRQQHLHSSQMFDYPELHEESTALMAFTLALQRVMYACSYTDFNVQDVIDPKPKRLVKILSAAINFYYFRNTRIEVFEATKSENERYQEQREYLRKSNDELKQRISKLKAKRAEQEPEIKKVQEDIEVLVQQMEENHKTSATMTKNTAELKKTIAEKKAAVDQLKLAILTSQQDGEKLSQKIVQSPERVKQEQERMEQKLAGLKMATDDKRTRGTSLENDHKKVKEMEACAAKALKLLQSIKQDVDKETQVVMERADCADRHQELQQTLGELTQKHDQLKHLLARRHEKRSKLTMQHRAKTENYKEQLTELDEKGQYGSDALDKERVKLVQAKDQVVRETQELEKTTAENLHKIHSLYSDIIVSVDKMHARLGKDWQSFRQVIYKSLDDLE